MTEILHKIVEQTSAGPVALYRGGEGPAVVLLHGNGHSIHEFDRVIPSLAGSFALTGWDMPGHGASNGCASTLTIEERADLLGDLLDKHVDDAAVLVGNSIGAFVAAALAVRRPERVASLLLVEMQLRVPAWWGAAWPMVESMFKTPQQDFEAVQARLCSPLTEPWLARWNEDRSRAGPASMIAAMEAIRDHDVMATLAQLRGRVHFLFGKKGPAVDCFDAALAAVPQGTGQVVGDAGHFISIDQPDAFAEAVRRAARATMPDK